MQISSCLNIFSLIKENKIKNFRSYKEITNNWAWHKLANQIYILMSGYIYFAVAFIHSVKGYEPSVSHL